MSSSGSLAHRRTPRHLADGTHRGAAAAGCPGLVLGLINADFPTGPLPPEVMHDVIRAPAYWAVLGQRSGPLATALSQSALGAAAACSTSVRVPAWSASPRFATAPSVAARDNDADAPLATLANARLNRVDTDACAELADAGRCGRRSIADLDDRTAVTFTVSPTVRAIRGHHPELQSPLEYMREHYFGPTLALMLSVRVSSTNSVPCVCLPTERSEVAPAPLRLPPRTFATRPTVSPPSHRGRRA